MQNVSTDVDAIIAKRRKQARLKSICGSLFLLVALGGLLNAWTERHVVFTYPAVWALGLAIVGAGFLLEARHIFRTNNEPKGYLTLFGQFVLCVGIFGTTALELVNKRTNGHAADFLLVLLVPFALAAVVLVFLAVRLAINILPLWFSLYFSRKR